MAFLDYTGLIRFKENLDSHYASLDTNGKVPSSQLPSYVDDVLEFSSRSSFPPQGESGVIYIDKSTNKTYRWSGSAYVAIASDLALGETESTAYRGDRGKAAYDAAVVNVDTSVTASSHLITSNAVKTAVDLKANKSDAIKNITRNTSTFTATKADGSTFTFTQRDNFVGLTGDETVAGSKTFTGIPFIKFTAGVGLLHFKSNDSICGTIKFDSGGTTTQSTNYFQFLCYSPNSSPTSTNTGKYEMFRLPSPDAGLTSNRTYDIYTSKNLTSEQAASGSGTKSLVTTGEKYNWNKAIKAISRSGTTFTATRVDGTTTTFTQQDTTYSAATATGAGLVSTSAQTFAGQKYFSSSASASSTSTGAVRIAGGLGVGENIYGAKVYNAVWNDYAECRKAETIEPGYCVTETGFGTMKKTTERLQAGCKITSDTFGTCMGETEEAKTPIAVAGRVLVYPYSDISKYELGAAVCSAPDGKVDIMSREEIREYPERIVGTVSEIPSYDIWYGGTKEDPKPISVNGRIWVYVR